MKVGLFRCSLASKATLTRILQLLIVGSGPSGLLLALLLAKKGVDVTLVERSTELDKQPRATHYAAPAIYELARAGVLDEMYEGGFVPDGVSWRKLDGTRLTGLVAKGVIPDDYPYRMVCYPLDRLGPLLLKHVKKLPNVQILWSHDVTSIGQDVDSAWVEAETVDGTKHISADYLVGCDGANSIVRRRLFGDFEFPGFTWDEQIVATNVRVAPPPLFSFLFYLKGPFERDLPC